MWKTAGLKRATETGKVSELERTENVLAELTPKVETFAGEIYPAEDVRRDQEALDNFRRTPNYSKGDERSDAKLLEKTFMDMAERGDWFAEDELYGDDPEYVALVTFPTAEIDDAFNHIDLIGVVRNEATGGEVLPFAIDLTYNTDAEKLQKKFGWKHVYGKKAEAAVEASEFSREVPLSKKKGLKLPGFAAAKYFEDLNNTWDPVIGKGRIEVMPRFVVGYAPEIADVLAQGEPTREMQQKYGDQVYQKRKNAYQTAELRAQWCTLVECNAQAQAMREMLDGLGEDEMRRMDELELAIAKKESAAMEEYFGRALEVAMGEAENDPRRAEAMKYARRDPVAQAILWQSQETFGEKR